jgi:hypothetical protein
LEAFYRKVVSWGKGRANDMSNTFLIEIEPLFRSHLAAAVARLSYLHPQSTFSVTETGVSVSTEDRDDTNLKREICYAVYRQQIYLETLPLRRTLIDGLLAR